MKNKILIPIGIFLSSLTTAYGQSTGQIDLSLQPNETGKQSLSIELVEDNLHVKGSMFVYDMETDGLAYEIREDSIYLKMIYKKNVSTSNIQTCDVDFTIPHCSGNSYTISLNKDSDGEPYNNLWMKVVRSGVTNIVSYEIKREDKQDRQELEYSLNNSELNITGYLFTNCCGLHSLVYRILADDIYIERCDEEPQCDCQEAHLVDIAIPGCPLLSYDIHLAPYTDDLPGTGEEVVVRDPVGIDTATAECFSVKYEDGYCQVNFPGNDARMIWTIDLFDSTGKKLLSKESNTTSMSVPVTDFVSEVYVCRITCNKNVYIQKIVIP